MQWIVCPNQGNFLALTHSPVFCRLSRSYSPDRSLPGRCNKDQVREVIRSPAPLRSCRESPEQGGLDVTSPKTENFGAAKTSLQQQSPGAIPVGKTNLYNAVSGCADSNSDLTAVIRSIQQPALSGHRFDGTARASSLKEESFYSFLQ